MTGEVQHLPRSPENDRVDARTLAHLLRTDLLPEAWIAPRPVKELRMVLRHRARSVRQRTLLKTRVHAVLADRGIGAPAALWASPGRKWLATVDLPDVERQVVEDLCGLLDAIELPISQLERR